MSRATKAQLTQRCEVGSRMFVTVGDRVAFTLCAEAEGFDSITAWARAVLRERVKTSPAVDGLALDTIEGLQQALATMPEKKRAAAVGLPGAREKVSFEPAPPTAKDPLPEAIAQAVALIREGWAPGEHEERAGLTPGPVEIPRVRSHAFV